MSTDVHQMHYRLRDLPTREVIFFPTRAQVVREIRDVQLGPSTGGTHITVLGVSPTVDQHSIKVEGVGVAKITEVNVELVANLEAYEDVYPSDEDDDESDDEDQHPWSEDDPASSDDEDLAAVTKKLRDLRARRDDFQEEVNSAAGQMAGLQSYAQSLSRSPPAPDLVQQVMSAYETSRAASYERHKKATRELVRIDRDVAKLVKEETKVRKAFVKTHHKALMVKAKAREAWQRKRVERQRAKAERIRDRFKFWPKQVYKIVISLDTTAFTPAASRRGSIDSQTTLAVTKSVNSNAVQQTNTFHQDSGKEPLAAGQIALSIAYMEYSAYWSPRYDLSLSTLNASGVLYYEAELHNTSSETWRDAKIVLSTSQTSFAGLSEAIPVLQPWHVRLQKGNFGGGSNALFSSAEMLAKQQHIATRPSKPRSQLFGEPDPYVAPNPIRAMQKPQVNMMRCAQPIPPPPPAAAAPSLFVRQMQGSGGQQQQQQAFGSQAPSGLFASRAPPTGPSPFAQQVQGFGGQQQQQQQQAFGAQAASGLFGSHAPPTGPSPFAQQVQGFGGQQQQQQQQAFGAQAASGLFGSHAPPAGVATMQAAPAASRLAGGQPSHDNDTESTNDIDIHHHEDEVDGPNPALAFEEGDWEETGLSTRYEVPNARTITPGSSASRHKIARVDFRSVIFSHIVIGKLRPVAFLKARLKNTSRITLLRGPLGLTLDGSFLGTSSQPRVASGETFSLSLGVDPSITVVYAKPTVRRSQSGLFTKEDCNVYTRVCTLRNTRANRQAEITVLDQVPVSEDERLRIDVTFPAGLKPGGAAVRAGAAVDDAGNAPVASGGKAGNTAAAKWGSASVEAKKGGEVAWKVFLDGGKGVKLTLQYECVNPGSESVVGV